MTPIFIDIATTKAQIARLLALHPEMQEDAKLLEDSLEGETDFHELLTRLLRMEREAVALASAVEGQAKSLTERAARFLRQRDTFRGMIFALMEAASQTKVRLPEATISIAADRAGCIVTDETALPEQFIETKRYPKKAAILAALLSGERVSGAELKNTATHLSIRV